MQLGLIKNSNQDYYGGPGVSASDLKVLRDATPLHLMAKKAQPFKLTDSLLMRGAVRCAVLEPDEFPYRFAEVPEGLDKRSKIGRELFAEIEAEGKAPLKADQYEKVKAISASIMAQPAVRFILAQHGDIRQSIYWQDRATGVLCKMRPHYMVEPCDAFPCGLLLEFTPVDDASPEAFKDLSFRQRHYMKAAWCQQGFQQTFGTPDAPPFLFLAYENSAPHASVVRSASARQIMLGMHENGEAMARYAQCEASGQWPGFSQEIEPVELPPWADKQLQDLQDAQA